MSELKVHASACNDERMVHTDDLRSAFVARLRKGLAHAGVGDWGAGAYLASITGRTAKAASKWLNAESMPGRANMLKIAEELGVRSEWLQFGEGSMTGSANNKDKESNVIAADFSQKRARDGEIDIPHYDVRAAMGAGQVLPSDYIETIRHVTVSLEFLRGQGVSCTQPDNLGMITGFGESMNKTFTSGDPLIIDKGVTSVVTDGVYLFTLSGALFVKRLQIIPGGIRVISDNDAYPPYDITGADLKHLVIHARVLLAWRSQRL
ncbi:LexA family transcriptional regulator [Halopseudomonas bauzanensis]|uniref:LexA family transcriptional regulator n=1 Tax=Halopseudomonas bauzanensis TaxID=653930 RepID=UPI0025535A1E|nr:S24 family peptidase [Halopseudomonas bauzanensis]